MELRYMLLIGAISIVSGFRSKSILDEGFLRKDTLGLLDNEEYCGGKPADVVFLLDASNSIWGPDFKKQLEFVQNIVSMFRIGEKLTRVGLATFNSRVQVQFNLNAYFNKTALLEAIGNVEETYGDATDTASAVRYMRKFMFSERHGSRLKVPRVAVVITDGQSSNILRTVMESSRAKRQNIHMFAVGVGGMVNKRELRGIASHPPMEYMFQVLGYGALGSVRNILAVRTCTVTSKPTPALTTKPARRTTTRQGNWPTEDDNENDDDDDSDDYVIYEDLGNVTDANKNGKSLLYAASKCLEHNPHAVRVIRKLTATTTPAPPPKKVKQTLLFPECREKPMDIVFAIDSSNDISRNDYWRQIRFVREVARRMDIGKNTTRVGLIVYADQVLHQFDLNDYTKMKPLLNRIITARRTAGGTRIDNAIRYVRTKSFRRSVSRNNTAQVAVVIAGTKSRNLHRTKKEANEARKAGLTLISIGVGSGIEQQEMEVISKDNNNSNRGFIIDTFDELDALINDTVVEACRSKIAERPVSDQPCGFRQQADLMFILDSVNAGRTNTKKSLEFVKSVSKAVDIDKENIQVGLMSAECETGNEGFSLGAHRNQHELMNALTEKRGTDITKLLKTMRRNSFRSSQGARKDAKKVAVVVVDGNLEQPLKALREARFARIRGVEVYVVAVGNDKVQKEMEMMCDAPTQQHFLRVENYDQLKTLKTQLIDMLCDEL